MIVDSSALIAILRGEEDAERFALAKSVGEPLLFNGEGFRRTAVEPA